MEKLFANDLVDPCFVDLDRSKRVSQFVGVATGHEIRRRPLQHGDVVALAGDGGHQCRRSCTGADDQNVLAFVVKVRRPCLGVNDGSLEPIPCPSTRACSPRNDGSTPGTSTRSWW